MGRKLLSHNYSDIISYENLLCAWREFVAGKKHRRDVQLFQYCLFDNILTLHHDLAGKTYVHGPYEAFNISDPKPRNIHKASVRDRLVHHAIYRVLYPFFDRTFIADSFSCRVDKGTHRALERFRRLGYRVGRNHTRTCWVLKCDIRKFFANIDHAVLLDILAHYIPDRDVMWLCERVIESFCASRPGVGLPLGNLTSQLFVNMYMNRFDQFIKHRVRAMHYIRYADDFVLLSADREWLEMALAPIEQFLAEHLRLQLHPNKVSIKTLASGVDFLGWVHFPDHRVLRTTTKRRLLKAMTGDPSSATRASYRGLLRHGNAHKLLSDTI